MDKLSYDHWPLQDFCNKLHRVPKITVGKRKTSHDHTTFPTNRIHGIHDQAVFKPSEIVSPLNPHTIVEETLGKDRGLPVF